MTYEPLRALVFFAIALPVCFIVVAFAFAVSQMAISPGAIIPWALGGAVCVGLIAGVRRVAQQP